MAKKNNRTPPDKEFSSNPFKHLKGLSVSGPESSTLKDAEPMIDTPPDVEEVPQSFVDEMAFLGVERLEQESGDVVDDRPIEKPVVEEPVEDDERLFQAAVGGLDKIFKDEWPVEDSPRSTPRRIKQVEQGRLKPESELDLHGLTRDEAHAKVQFFLEDACYQGARTVLIITGKGTHSNEGPVLRRAVEALLEQSRDRVMEWGVAPRRYGGSGALVVFLRKA